VRRKGTDQAALNRGFHSHALTSTNPKREHVSLDAQDWVWEHSASKNTARLVLLAIADKASGPDVSAYAGTTFLVRRSRASRTSVIKAVDALLESGELEIVLGQKGPHGETRYRLPGAKGHTRKGGTDSVPVQNPYRSQNETPRGTESVPGGSGIRTGRGSESVPHNAVNADTPEGTHKEGAEASSNQPRPTAPPARPDGPLAPTPIEIDGFQVTDAMRAWALRTYGPALDIDHATAQFVSHYRSTGARRKSWPDAWQKWIRDDAKRATERANRPTQGTFLVAVNGQGQTAPRPSTTDQRVMAAREAGRRVQARMDAIRQQETS
jgi:hypothetical protein